MSLETIFSELRQRFRNEFEQSDARSPGLAMTEFRGWASSVNLSEDELSNEVALHLAKGFLAGELPFAYCDHIVNCIYPLALERDRLPEPFWSVFLAFDAGEYFRDDDRSVDPADKYTRPQLIEILSQYSQQSP